MGFLREECNDLFEERCGGHCVGGREGEGNVGGNAREGEGIELFAKGGEDFAVEGEEIGAGLKGARVGVVGDECVHCDCEGMV